MEKNYTVNTLIKYIYGECDLFERLETEYAISTDAATRKEYYALSNSLKSMPNVKFSPRKSTINRILDFA